MNFTIVPTLGQWLRRSVRRTFWIGLIMIGVYFFLSFQGAVGWQWLVDQEVELTRWLINLTDGWTVLPNFVMEWLHDLWADVPLRIDVTEPITNTERLDDLWGVWAKLVAGFWFTYVAFGAIYILLRNFWMTTFGRPEVVVAPAAPAAAAAAAAAGGATPVGGATVINRAPTNGFDVLKPLSWGLGLWIYMIPVMALFTFAVCLLAVLGLVEVNIPDLTGIFHAWGRAWRIFLVLLVVVGLLYFLTLLLRRAVGIGRTVQGGAVGVWSPEAIKAWAWSSVGSIALVAAIFLLLVWRGII